MKFKVKSLCVILFFMFSNHILYSQSLYNLKEDKGYKEIKLGNDITEYDCFEQIGRPTGFQSLAFATSGIDQSKILNYKFAPNSQYPYYKIGDVEIYNLEVMTYNQKIYEIKIYLAPHVDILPILKYRFGENTSYDDLLFPSYKWKTNDGIVCELIGYGGGERIKTYILQYKDEKIADIMKQEAEKQKESNRLERERKLRNQAKSGF